MTGLLATNVLRDILDQVRDRFPVSAVVARDLKLVRAGNELKACCPFHADRTPSFTIYAGDRRWHCFGCGLTGDVVDYVRRVANIGLREAVLMLDGGAWPVVVQDNAAALRKLDDADFTAAAARIWRNAVPVDEATPAYRYLASRRLGGPVPAVFRFARLRCKLHDGGDGPRHPALVALVVDVAGEPVGVQRTFLREDGVKAFGKDSKLSLGRVKGGAIRMAPAGDEVAVTEGAEDALSLQRMAGVPTWAAAGAGMLPAMLFPLTIRTVTIGADADAAGEKSATAAAAAFAERGLLARIVRPVEGCKDFNDELQGDAHGRL